MEIFVKAKPGAKKPEIKRLDDARFVVAVSEQARDGKANEAVVKALALYFKIPVSRVRIVKGHSHRQKIVEIL